MKAISIGGACAEELAGFMAPQLPDGCTVLVEGRETPDVSETALVVLVTDAPLGPGKSAEVVLVEKGPAFVGVPELGIERQVKGVTGAGKVLIYSDDEGRERAFRKVLDIAVSRLGGVEMLEDIPPQLIERIKAEAPEGRISCERAHEIAREMGLDIPLVGRALDLLRVKIVKCELGCF